MPTKLTVFNDALLLLGQPMMQDPADSGEDGDQLRAAWEPSVEICHEKTEWDHAVKRWQCARLASVPTNGYYYYYAIPADALRIITVSETGEVGDDLIAYEIEEGKLATNAQTVYIRYVSDDAMNNPGRWSASFAYFVSCTMAARVAPKINQSALEHIIKERKKAQSDAIGLDAAQGPPKPRRHGMWSRSARGWGVNVDREFG